MSKITPMTKTTPRAWMPLLLAVAITVTLLVPSAQAGDGSDVAVIFLDSFNVGGTLYANVTAFFPNGWQCSPTGVLYGHKTTDGGNPTNVFSGSLTRLGTSNTGFINQSVSALNYDAFAATITWGSGGLCNIVRETASFRASDVYTLTSQQNFQGWFNTTYQTYVDNTFEGQVHANETWCVNGNDLQYENEDPEAYCLSAFDINTILSDYCGKGPTPDPFTLGPFLPKKYCVQNEFGNNTFEGQVHANATWCPMPCSSENMTIGNLTIRNLILGGNFSGNGENITNVTAMTVEGLPPKATNLGFMLSLLLLAGIGVGFVSKTNPLAPFGGMIAEVIGIYLSSGSASTLGTNTQVFIMAFSVAILVLAAKAFFMFRMPAHGENATLER